MIQRCKQAYQKALINALTQQTYAYNHMRARTQTHIHINKQTNKQTNKQASKQTSKQANKQTSKNKQT